MARMLNMKECVGDKMSHLTVLKVDVKIAKENMNLIKTALMSLEKNNTNFKYSIGNRDIVISTNQPYARVRMTEGANGLYSAQVDSDSRRTSESLMNQFVMEYQKSALDMYFQQNRYMTTQERGENFILQNAQRY